MEDPVMNPGCQNCKNSDYFVNYHCSEFHLLKCNQSNLALKSYDKKLEREDVQLLQESVYSNLKRKDISKVRTMAFDRLKLMNSFKNIGYLLDIGC